MKQLILFIICAMLTAKLFAQHEVGRPIVKISCSGSVDNKMQPVLLAKMRDAIGSNRQYIPITDIDLKPQFSLVLTVGSMAGRKYIIGELVDNTKENYASRKTKSYVFEELDELTDICNQIADELIGANKSFPSVNMEQLIAEQKRLTAKKEEEKKLEEKKVREAEEKESYKRYPLRKGFEINANFIGGDHSGYDEAQYGGLRRRKTEDCFIFGGDIVINYRTPYFVIGFGMGYPHIGYLNMECNFTKRKLSPFIGLEIGGVISQYIVEDVDYDYTARDFYRGSSSSNINILDDDYKFKRQYYMNKGFGFYIGWKVGIRYSFNENLALQIGFKNNWILGEGLASRYIGYTGIVYHFKRNKK